MSDSQLSIHQPVYPQEPSRQGSSAEDNHETVETVPTASQTPSTIEIDGKSYTEDQLKSFIGEGLRQADYTRKTQELARQREQLQSDYQARLDELETLKAEMSSRTIAASPEGEDEISQIKREIRSVKDELKAELTRDRQQREKDLAVIQAEGELEQALDAFEGQPFFNREEMEHVMNVQGLKPHQAQVAYNYLYGARIGQEYGRIQAIRQGASARPPMGANESSISPGFTALDQIAKNSESLYQANGRMRSMKDFTRMALNDPEIP